MTLSHSTSRFARLVEFADAELPRLLPLYNPSEGSWFLMSRAGNTLSEGTPDLLSSYLRSFQLFLYLHPFASANAIDGILRSCSERLFRIDANPFVPNDDLCSAMPLTASFTNFALCVGAHYSRDDYNVEAASSLYENGKRYFRSHSMPFDVSPVRALIIFLWVY